MNPGAKNNRMRINRFLARAGVGSRREVEALVTSGRVSINGTIIKDLATYVDPESDSITLGDAKVELPDLVYYKYYKPRGLITTMEDTHGRESIEEIIRKNGLPKGTVPAGRLDMESEGLLILTNDGDLLNKLTHPSHEITKVYRVLIDCRPEETELNLLRGGIDCGEFIAIPKAVKRMGPQPADDEFPDGGYWLEITLGEGKKREIREMLKAVNHAVFRLIRIQHGPVKTGQMKIGDVVEISEEEKKSLLK